MAVMPSFLLSTGYNLSSYQQQPSAWEIINPGWGGGGQQGGRGNCAVEGWQAQCSCFQAPLAEVTCVTWRVTVFGTWNTPGLRAGRGSATGTPVVT